MPRLVGKGAALYVSTSGTFSWVADLYDWALETELVLVDASIKGDGAERHMTSHTRGRLTAKRYIQAGGTLVGGDFLTPGVRLDWAIVVADPTLAAGGSGNPANFSTAGPRAQGTGFVSRSNVNAPRGMASDDFEITLDTIPVIT